MSRLICERGVKDVNAEDTKHNLVSPESAMFVHIFLILVRCTIATRRENFHMASDEEMPKPISHSFDDYQ